MVAIPYQLSTNVERECLSLDAEHSPLVYCWISKPIAASDLEYISNTDQLSYGRLGVVELDTSSEPALSEQANLSNDELVELPSRLDIFSTRGTTCVPLWEQGALLEAIRTCKAR